MSNCVDDYSEVAIEEIGNVFLWLHSEKGTWATAQVGVPRRRGNLFSVTIRGRVAHAGSRLSRQARSKAQCSLAKGPVQVTLFSPSICKEDLQFDRARK